MMPYKDSKKKRENHTRYMREVWYPNNRDKHKALTIARRKKNREEIKAYLNLLKMEKGCADCGNRDFRVLDFDHLEDKLFTISKFVGSANSLLMDKEIILKEVAKCEVRCANCHRIITWERKHGGLV